MSSFIVFQPIHSTFSLYIVPMYTTQFFDDFLEFRGCPFDTVDNKAKTHFSLKVYFQPMGRHLRDIFEPIRNILAAKNLFWICLPERFYTVPMYPTQFFELFFINFNISSFFRNPIHSKNCKITITSETHCNSKNIRSTVSSEIHCIS